MSAQASSVQSTCRRCNDTVQSNDYFCKHCGIFILPDNHNFTTRDFGRTYSHAKPWKQMPLGSRNPGAVAAVRLNPVQPRMSSDSNKLARKLRNKRLTADKKLAESEKQVSFKGKVLGVTKPETLNHIIFPLTIHEASWLPIVDSTIHTSLITKTFSGGSSERFLRIGALTSNKTLRAGFESLHWRKQLQDFNILAVLTQVTARLILDYSSSALDISKIDTDDFELVTTLTPIFNSIAHRVRYVSTACPYILCNARRVNVYLTVDAALLCTGTSQDCSLESIDIVRPSFIKPSFTYCFDSVLHKLKVIQMNAVDQVGRRCKIPMQVSAEVICDIAESALSFVSHIIITLVPASFYFSKPKVVLFKTMAIERLLSPHDFTQLLKIRNTHVLIAIVERLTSYLIWGDFQDGQWQGVLRLEVLQIELERKELQLQPSLMSRLRDMSRSAVRIQSHVRGFIWRRRVAVNRAIRNAALLLLSKVIQSAFASIVQRIES